MSHLSDIANIIIGLVREADATYDTYGARSTYDLLTEEVKVELASLIEDANNDSSIRKEAEALMAEHMDKE